LARRLRYRKKANQAVTAVKLDLETDGLRYRKWGSEQLAKRGDWLIDNAGEIYSVDGKSFARTYELVEPGRYVKKTPVWAEQATEAGAIATKEGSTRYRRGDYIVYNERRGGDGYAVSAAKFKAMYRRD
jgi:hypothetical protein